MLFTESTFVSTINILREQYAFDTSYSMLLGNLLKSEDVPVYDNSKLVNQLFLLMQEQFPPKNGVCEIERYCWELNFGYNNGVQVITSSDLYHSLVSGKPVGVADNYHEDDVHEIAAGQKDVLNVNFLKNYHDVTIHDLDALTPRLIFVEDHNISIGQEIICIVDGLHQSFKATVKGSFYEKVILIENISDFIVLNKLKNGDVLTVTAFYAYPK